MGWILAGVAVIWAFTETISLLNQILNNQKHQLEMLYQYHYNTGYKDGVEAMIVHDNKLKAAAYESGRAAKGIVR